MATNRQYEKAISQQNRSALSRGMGRSSYALQTEANLRDQKAKARNQLGEALIADYQNRVSQLDEAEAARAFQREERLAQQEWQAGENALARAFQTSEREAQANAKRSRRTALRNGLPSRTGRPDRAHLKERRTRHSLMPSLLTRGNSLPRTRHSLISSRRSMRSSGRHSRISGRKSSGIRRCPMHRRLPTTTLPLRLPMAAMSVMRCSSRPGSAERITTR